MILVRSWVYTACFLAWTLLMCVLGLPTMLRRRWARAWVKLWVRSVMWLARVLVGVTWRVTGREHLPEGPCIIAAQHQASFETYLLYLIVERPIFILKRELTWIPFVGWYIRRIGLVSIDRAAGANAMRKVLRAAQKALDAGSQVLIFPEGTRTAPGAVRAYQPGVAALYAHCDAPVVPLALNSGHIWGKTRITKMPGEITLAFLPPLPKGLGREEMLAELRRSIDTAARALPGNTPGRDGGL